jgi:drug/metabolite transporter (DMT)-like permease
VALLSVKLPSATVDLPGNLHAMSLMMVSTVSRSALHATIRHASAGMHAFELLFFQNFIGLFFMLPWIVRYGFAPLRTTRLKLQILRVIITVVSASMLFYALSITPLARIAALTFLVPIFTTVLAIFFLGETVRLRRWLAILFGFAGTFVVVRPGIDAVDLGSLLTIASSIIFSFALLLTKIISRTDSSVTITCYSVMLMTPMSLAAAVFVWHWPEPHQIIWLIVIGMLSTGSQLIGTQALKEGDMNVLLPLDFFKLIWSSIIGYAFFSEIPSIYTWLGGTMIFASVTYIACRESKFSKAKTAQPTT